MKARQGRALCFPAHTPHQPRTSHHFRPNLALATAPLLPTPPQHLSRAHSPPFSSHISHALSQTLPPVESFFLNPTTFHPINTRCFFLLHPHRYLTTSASVLALTVLHHTFFTPHPTRPRHYVNHTSPYHTPSATRISHPSGPTAQYR